MMLNYKMFSLQSKLQLKLKHHSTEWEKIEGHCRADKMANIRYYKTLYRTLF